MNHRDASDRQRAFEARLASLQQRVEAGFGRRAEEIRSGAARLQGGDQAARQALKTHGHRLRGIAGTYGHDRLGELAAELERISALSPAATVAALAYELADAVAAASGRDPARPTTPAHVTAPAPAGGSVSARPTVPAAVPAPAVPAPAIPASQPLRPTLPVSPKKGADAGAAAEGVSLRVLAVDDDPLTLRLLTLTLRQVGGFRATIVSSAREALTLLAGDGFDLVISDAMMPDMNGLEFCRAARALGPNTARLPMVILSAATADELGWRGQLDPHTTWVRKPFRPSALVEQLAAIAAGGGRR